MQNKKNFKKINIALAVLLSIVLVFTARAYALTKERFDPMTVYGPRLDKICMVIIKNSDTQVLAAEKGEIDIVSDIVLPSDIDRLSRNTNFSMSLARGYHAFFLLLNNKTYPFDNKFVRQAAACAIDKDNIVRTIYSGYCEPINTWLPPVSIWALPEASRSVYSPKDAKDKLKALGYSWSLTGTLISPDGKPMPKIKLLTPMASVAPTTAELAEQIADCLYRVGFPVEVEPMDFSAMISKLDRKEYSMAVLAWGLGQTPESLYSFYHSEMDKPGGNNLTGTNNKELDAALSELRFAPSKQAAKKASDKAQRMLADIVPSVPIYSRFSVAAVSRGWKNILKTDKITADNMWTLMMTEPKDGTKRPLYMVLADEPRNLNPFTATTAYSWQILGMVYEGLIGTNPLTLENMPALASSWEIKTKGQGEKASTDMYFNIAKGLKWNDGSPITAHDIKATIDFIKINQIPRFFDSVKDIKSVTVINDHKLTVHAKGASYWHLSRTGGLPCMPKQVIDGIKDWQNWNPLDKSKKYGSYGLVGSGPFMIDEYRQGEYVMMKKNPYYRLLSNHGGNNR